MENVEKEIQVDIIAQLNKVVEALVASKEDMKDISDLEFSKTQLHGDASQRVSFFTDYAKFSGEVANPKNTKVNPFHKSKYAPLDEVLNVVRPVMSKYGFSLLQIPTIKNTKVMINCLLMHKGGAFMTIEALEMPMTKPDAQGIGSSITYGRRYAVASLCGVASEEDDDGNTASGLPNAPKGDKPPVPQNTTPVNKEMSLAQAKARANADAKALFDTKGQDVVKAKISEILENGTIAGTTEENKEKLITLIEELKKL